ncbi:PREDICTED: probable disease resistance protein RF45 [Camelina sativa]|uniref:Probable disease resistance protein RF45 n=1 Tax=Camelina sativa TaxID=90675 RepID=A0ABM0SQN7_CAMSA|nr:PREDICTED: probable disease resistance protein RF45 [Camelina sativa]
MAAEAIVGELTSFGIQKLWDLLSQECERFQGIDEQVTELKRYLNWLSCFLKDADTKKHTSAMVRNCVKEIQDIVYDAEDIIETYLQKEILGKAGTKNRIRRLACIIPDRRQDALDTRGILTRISTVISDMEGFGVKRMIVQTITDGGCIPQHQRGIQTFSKDHESDFVGLEANVKKLVELLVEKDDIQIVSVTGMGGLGKTTIASQVFNHEDVRNQFERLAWVCVSQEFTRISVWQTILQNLTSKERKGEIQNMNEVELQDELFSLLEKSKSLIVFDDIWKREDWDKIKPIFPPRKGWKVLLTSRNDGVAMHDATHVKFKPEFLTDEDSWTLFERKAMPRKDDPEYKVYEKLGKEMVKHCKGLPLAVKALGGLLNEVKRVDYWERLSTNIGSHNVIGRTSANDNSIDRVLSLSFEELPGYLKHCFLYLAHFPEDYGIQVEDLAYYWAAEGIPRHGETIREAADGYIEELVKRNMVISERDAITSRYKTCQLHDVMRDLCLLKAEEENFVHGVKISASTATSQSPCKSRRIAVHGSNDETYLHEGDIPNPKLRSLLFIRFRMQDMMLSRKCFSRLQLLRVLDLYFPKFKGGKLSSSIGKLIHLRYLSLRGAEVHNLPSSMCNLRKLLYLNLDVSCKSLIYIPNIFQEMRELAYLYLPKEMDNKTKLELGNLINLETLKNFATKHSSVKDLQRMTRLEDLSILFSGDGYTMKTLSSSLSEMRHLEYLAIEEGVNAPKNDEEGFVLDCVHLKILEMKIYMPKLPDEQHFPSHLTTITLTDCRLVEDPMPILEKLVQLRSVHLHSQSFSGRRMVCSGGGFPQLRGLTIFGLEELEEWIVEEGSMPLLRGLWIWGCSKLKQFPAGGFPQLEMLSLSDLDNLKEWIVEEGSMPLLHFLDILDCPKLKELPNGLRVIYSLKKLTMDEDWEERLSEGGEDYQKFKHIPTIEFRAKRERFSNY